MSASSSRPRQDAARERDELRAQRADAERERDELRAVLEARAAAIEEARWQAAGHVRSW